MAKSKKALTVNSALLKLVALAALAGVAIYTAGYISRVKNLDTRSSAAGCSPPDSQTKPCTYTQVINGRKYIRRGSKTRVCGKYTNAAIGVSDYRWMSWDGCH